MPYTIILFFIIIVVVAIVIKKAKDRRDIKQWENDQSTTFEDFNWRNFKNKY